MKNYLYISLIMCFLNNIQAQEPMPKVKLKFEHSVGINTISVLRKILKVNSDSAFTNSYLFMYKLRFGKNGIRCSGSANLNNETEHVEGFLDTKSIKRASYAARFGFERQSIINKRFMASYGFDGVWEYHINKLISDSGFDKVSIIDTKYGVGGGPFLGITWSLGKNLSLYTEAAVYFSQGRKAKLSDFEKNPDFNDVKTSFNFSKINYLIPTGLFLQYHF